MTGSFTYALADGITPAQGVVLPFGNAQALEVTFTPSDTADYTSATIFATIDIHPATLTITPDSQSMIYGESAPAFGVSPAGYAGLVNGDLPSVVSGLTCDAADAAGNPVGVTTAAGSYAITCSDGTAANYSISYQPGTLTIEQAPLTITPDNQSMTYGGGVPAFGVSPSGYSGLVNGDLPSVVLGQTCDAVDTNGNPVSVTTPAGTYPITCSGGIAANYGISYKPATLTVKQASLLIVPGYLFMTYGGPVPPLLAPSSMYLGLVNGDTPSVVSGTTCQAMDDFFEPVTSSTLPGPYWVTCWGGTAANYSVSYVNSGVLYISPAPLTITPDNQTMTYSGSVPTFGVSPSGFVGLVNGDMPSVISGLVCRATDPSEHSVTSATPAGTYPISCADDGTQMDYSITYQPGTLTVQQSPLTITPDNQTMTYGGAVPAFSVSPGGYSGLVNGDLPSVVSGLTCNATDAHGSPVNTTTPTGTYAIACSEGSAANYAISYRNGTLTISGAATCTDPSCTPGGTATPELASGELLVTGLSPLLVVVYVRRRARRRGRPMPDKAA